MNKGNYQAILFHPEGDFVTDARNTDSIEETWDKINNFGSRWVFFPIPFVATDKTIVGTCEGIEFLKGKRIKTVKKYFAWVWGEVSNLAIIVGNGDLPLSCAYNIDSFAAFLKNERNTVTK